MEQYADVQQLMKKEDGQNRKPIYPPTVIQAVFDGKTGASLEAILAQFNSIYVQYQGTPKDTRLIIPMEMRRAGLTITYMDMESNTITERANSAVQKDNDHWALDVNWSRVDELSLSGDISVSANGTWIINGTDTGVKAVGPKGDTGLTPWLKTIDNKLHFSYDNVTWEPCSENIAAWFRWNDNKIQISRDNKTWADLSGKFADNVHVKGYVANYASLPSGAVQGDIYGVGPTYAAEDTAHTNPIYRYYVRNANSWVDNGSFTSISAGVVQETGDSETEVMSQKAVSEKLSELGSKPTFFSNYIISEGIDLNTFFKELYIEGLSEDKEYILRTLQYNSTTNSYQIDIAEKGVDAILFEIAVPFGENYGYVVKGNIKAHVVLNNIEKIDKTFLFKNKEPIYVIYKGKVSDLSLSPYIHGLYLSQDIESISQDIESAKKSPLKELYVVDANKGTYIFEVKKKTDGNLYVRLSDGSTIVSYVGLPIEDSTGVIVIKEHQSSGVTGYVVIDESKVPLDDSNYYSYGLDWDMYNLFLSPTINEYINNLNYNKRFNDIELNVTDIEKNITDIEENISVADKPIFFNSVLDGYFKELYIEGLDENTDYCLRTFGYNPTGYFQINIGTSDSNIIEIAIYPQDNNYKFRQKEDIKVWVVLQNTEQIQNYLLFANTDVEKTKLNKSNTSNIILSPYIQGIIEKDNEIIYNVPLSFNGFALPKKPDSLKILSVGNSFADQPLSTLIGWLNGLGITQVTYGIISKAGGTLQQHYEGLTTEYDAYFRTTVNKDGVQQPWVYCNPATGEQGTPPIKLCDALAYTDWDIITFHQQSGNSGIWSSIEPYLPKLIEAARYYCPNSGAKIAWQQTWAFAKGFTNIESYGYESQEKMVDRIIQCSKNVVERFGIDLIIPNCVVMQHLRSIPNSFWGDKVLNIKGGDEWTSDSPMADFCEDGLHPNAFAEYCLGATFVQLLINSCFNKTIRNSNVSMGDASGDFAKVARQCVLKAIGNRFELSNIDVMNLLE